MFCTENNLILSSESFLPGGTFTHYSEAWDTTSWLDHCISTSDANEIINNTSRVPVEWRSSVCLICMKYRIIFFNYYHYQPGSNIIIVYC